MNSKNCLFFFCFFFFVIIKVPVVDTNHPDMDIVLETSHGINLCTSPVTNASSPFSLYPPTPSVYLSVWLLLPLSLSLRLSVCLSFFFSVSLLLSVSLFISISISPHACLVKRCGFFLPFNTANWLPTWLGQGLPNTNPEHWLWQQSSPDSKKKPHTFLINDLNEHIKAQTRPKIY